MQYLETVFTQVDKNHRRHKHSSVTAFEIQAWDAAK